MLANGLEDYLKEFVAPFPADWPMQFFMRQIVNNTALVISADCLQECHPTHWPTAHFLKLPRVIFADFYSFLFR